MQAGLHLLAKTFGTSVYHIMTLSRRRLIPHRVGRAEDGLPHTESDRDLPIAVSFEGSS